jgi:DNA-binding GntR family transcriptional regulator
MPFDTLSPVGPQLYRTLRARIVTGELPPGSRLSESDVAESYTVSRQPAREAFIKLAEEGLLEVRPQRGTFVRKISTRAVMDARFVREAIEADVVKLVAEAAEPGLVKELRRQIRDQRRVEEDPRAFVALDDRFHRTLAEAADKASAWGVLEGLKTQMDRVRQLSTRQFPIRKLIEQHAAVCDAIEKGDVEAAEAAMRHHLRGILKDLPAIAESKPEYFDD